MKIAYKENPRSLRAIHVPRPPIEVIKPRKYGIFIVHSVGECLNCERVQGSNGAAPREWRGAATKCPAASKDKIYKLLSRKYEEIF